MLITTRENWCQFRQECHVLYVDTCFWLRIRVLRVMVFQKLTSEIECFDFLLQVFSADFLRMCRRLKPRLYLIHVARIQVVSTCIHLCRLSPSTLYPVSAKKIVVNKALRRQISTFIHLYPDTCCSPVILVYGYMYLV